MKFIIRIAILINLFSFSLKAQHNHLENITKPYSQINFNSGKWTLVLSEIITDSTFVEFEKDIKIISLISDQKILDSLKTSFECDPSKESDGYHCFVIDLYQDNKLFSEYVFDSRNHFDFGELNKYFKPIKKEKDETIIGTKKLNQKKEKLLKKNIDFFYSSEFDHLYKHYSKKEKHDKNDYKSDFTFSIEISFNTLHNMGIDRKGAIHELTKIFPEIKDVIFSCNGNQRKDNYRYYKISFPCSFDFILNSDKLKQKDNVVAYKIIGIKPTEYYLTTLIK